VLLYGVVIGGAAVAIAVKHGWRYLPLLPVILFAIHSGLGIGFLGGAFQTIRTHSRNGQPAR